MHEHDGDLLDVGCASDSEPFKCTRRAERSKLIVLALLKSRVATSLELHRGVLDAPSTLKKVRNHIDLRAIDSISPSRKTKGVPMCTIGTPFLFLSNRLSGKLFLIRLIQSSLSTTKDRECSRRQTDRYDSANSVLPGRDNHSLPFHLGGSGNSDDGSVTCCSARHPTPFLSACAQ